MNKNRHGYTIVEVLISAAIILAAIAAVVVILSSGSKINMDDLLRRRAFQVMEEVLERPTMSFNNYSNLQESIGGTGAGKSTVLALGNEELYRNGADVFFGTVTCRLVRILQANSTGTNVPAIKATVIVNYNNTADSLSTIITDIPLE